MKLPAVIGRLGLLTRNTGLSEIPKLTIYYNMQSNSSSLHLLVVGRIIQDLEIAKLTAEVVSYSMSLTSTSVYFLDQPTCNAIAKATQAQPILFDRSLHCRVIDYTVTIGGDGTILYAAKEFKQKCPPFLTFHQGTLGFLCKFRVSQRRAVLDQAVLLKKEKQLGQGLQPFQKCQLMRIQSLFTHRNRQTWQQNVVLNEVAITRKDKNRIILDIFINGEEITTTAGDGILISTPTGSTAYALSAGGPVVLSGVNCIVLVPIAPNSLSFRPICLPSNSVIRIRLSPQSRSPALVSFDGQSSLEMGPEDEIEISHQPGHDIEVLEFAVEKNTHDHMPTWMQRLKTYLGWNEVFKSPSCNVMSKGVEKIQVPECEQKCRSADNTQEEAVSPRRTRP